MMIHHSCPFTKSTKKQSTFNTLNSLMEPIGATASFIALVGLTIKTAKIINSITYAYRNAPNELVDLKYQINGLSCQLVLLQHVQKSLSVDELSLEDSEIKNLESFFSDIIPVFESIREFFESKSVRKGKGKQIIWAFKDAPKIRKWEQNLQRHSCHLTNILHLLEMYLFLPQNWVILTSMMKVLCKRCSSRPKGTQARCSDDKMLDS